MRIAYNKLILMSGLVLLLASCGKNLDQTPKSTASKSAVFGSEDGLKLYTTSFYNMLPDLNTAFRTDCNLSDFGATTTVPDFLRTGAFTSRQSSGWSWGNLRNVNYFINNCNDPALPLAVRENYIGIARFFRAYFYFEMVKRFGDVPWYNRPLEVTDSALYKPRDPRTMIMDSVVADLDYAASKIIATDDQTRSTITKWVVYGFKSRVCLFEGTFRKYQTSFGLTGSADKFLQMAAEAAKAVIDSKKYSLNTAGGNLAYRNLFISAAPVASEVMLANITSSALGKNNDANWYYTSATYGSRFSFTRMFVNTYLNTDGTPFTDKTGYQTTVFSDEVQNRDLRLQQTIRMGGYKRVSGGSLIPGPPVFSYTYTGYQPIKWCLDDMYYDAGTLNTNAVCLMRYAEVLLNYAEAQAELGAITAADWSATIGALRARAGITGGLTTLPVVADPYLTTNYFPDITSAAILEVRRERGIELALEGFRFHDLVRWKRGDLLLKQWNGFYVPSLNTPMDLNNDGIMDVAFYRNTLPSPTVPGVTYVNVTNDPQKLSNGTSGELHWLDNIGRDWQDYKYLYPIPYADLQINPKLKQNAGWQ
ncbi:RagB/SusD family nutrient uptake outer membrane protein [Sediminibacterium soli]|uniref:RagB/SusD family nutrient uptake outer membrane protein n=1 Tax=Sediminibacterium soli TaxID=2698829 RepID=UPI00137B11BF|nr:RagB/SusD family nutrient uptake outer membrane protein [Sediminibacterium soli]NCI45234.1 RagB/SusD family nutrient uptake outer membrane protein [Sediminibacterium soli]